MTHVPPIFEGKEEDDKAVPFIETDDDDDLEVPNDPVPVDEEEEGDN